jgi:cob(I)alamin adenosyltransferase
MSEFDAPRLAINRVYTRKGDAGTTALAGGQRLSKADRRIAAYGDVDELCAWVGIARQSAVEAAAATPALAPLAEMLLAVQHTLFNCGSILATLPADVHPKQARPTPADVTALEADMDRHNEALEPLRSFVLPGGCRLNAELHVARTVCRRAERACVALAAEPGSEVDPLVISYLNRLSDALFVWSRAASHMLGVPEVLWDPNRAKTGA